MKALVKSVLLLLLVFTFSALAAQKAPRLKRVIREADEGQVVTFDSNGKPVFGEQAVRPYVVGATYPDGALVNVDGIIYRNIAGGDNSNAIPGDDWSELDIVGNSEIATIANATVTSNLSLYGIAPVFSNSSSVVRPANTAAAANLHQYYIVKRFLRNKILGSGAVKIKATFPYVVGTAYYLNDSGTLSTSADANYSSPVLYVISNPSSGTYIVNLSSPRHFAQ